MHLLLVDVWSFLLSEYACVAGYIEKWNAQHNIFVYSSQNPHWRLDVG